MFPFLSLPNELIEAIAEYLPQEELNSLVRTNRHLHLLLNRDLYRRDISDYGRALRWASRQDRTITAQRLFDYGASMRIQQGYYPLLEAAETNSERMVRFLIAHDGVDPEGERTSFRTFDRSEFRTPVLEAIYEGHDNIVRLLLAAKGTNVLASYMGNDAFNVLHSAVQVAHADVIRALLGDERIDPNARYDDGRTPLIMAACFEYNTEVIEALLEDDRVDVNARGNDGLTAIGTAVRCNVPDATKVLLADSRVSTQYKDSDPDGLLLLAVRVRCERAAEVLLASGRFNPNAMGNRNEHALCIATRADNDKMLATLLAADGINIDVFDRDGRSLVMVAVQERCTDCLGLLLNDGRPDPDVLEPRRRITPLMYAAWMGHDDSMEMLLATGRVDLRRVSGFGWSATKFAAASGHAGVLAQILSVPEYEPEDETDQPMENTVLGHAAKRGHVEVLQVLMQDGRLSLKDQKGHTPLMVAADSGHREAVEVLLASGKLDVRDKTHNGWTALRFAQGKGHDVVSKMIADHEDLLFSHSHLK